MSSAETSARTPSIALTLTLLCLLFFSVWLGLRSVSVTQRPSSQTGTALSIERVQTTIEHIANVPHPMGTPQNDAVRDYLVEQLRALGLETRVQPGFGIEATSNGTVAGFTQNIVARLPGSEHGKALMLSAHYDSVPNGPGAADDGASVAAILETLRALKASAPLKNDLIVLFSDGEEAGMLGAHAFTASDPWAKDVGLDLNFEFRGDQGPIYMFQSSPGNAALISGLATVPRPIATSLMSEIYRIMPNNTDMSVFLHAHVPGLNFAAIGGLNSYHTPLDTADRISPATLDHLCETMLATTLHFGNADLNALGNHGDEVYFNLPGVGLISYPATLALPLSALSLVLFGIAFVRGTRHGALRAGRTLLALPLTLLVAALLAIAALLVWLSVCMIHPEYHRLPEMYNAAKYWFAFMMLAVGGFTWLVGLARFPVRPLELAMGAMLGWTLASLASALWAPGFNFLLCITTLPLLAVFILRTGKGTTANETPQTREITLLVVAAVPGIILFTPLVFGLLQAFSTHATPFAIFVVTLFLALVSPLLAALRRPFIMPTLPLAIGLMSIAIGLITTHYDAAHPEPDSLAYVRSGNQALWVSPDDTLDGWTRAVFGASPTRRALTEVYGPLSRKYWVAPAPAVDLPPPAVQLLHDTVMNGTREVTLRIRSVRNAPEIRLFPEVSDLFGVSINGQDAGGVTHSRWGLILHALPAEGAEVTFKLKAGEPFTLRAIDRSYGLPDQGLPPRPATTLLAAEGSSSTMQSETAIKF